MVTDREPDAGDTTSPGRAPVAPQVGGPDVVALLDQPRDQTGVLVDVPLGVLSEAVLEDHHRLGFGGVPAMNGGSARKVMEGVGGHGAAVSA
jgi:hypothetical protein